MGYYLNILTMRISNLLKLLQPSDYKKKFLLLCNQCEFKIIKNEK